MKNKKNGFFTYIAGKYQITDAELYKLLGWDRRRYWQRTYWDIRCGDALALSRALRISPKTIFNHWLEWVDA